jgi:DNA-binding NarL/FixJ family response regulator
MDDESESIRILLADDQLLFREAVKVVLSREEGIVVVGEAKDGLQAVAEAERTRPDLAFVDSKLPNCAGVRATGLIKERVPECRVVVLSDEEDPGLLVDAIEAGASGFMTKTSPLASLIEATHAIHAGEMLIPPRMLTPLLTYLISRGKDKDKALRRISRLTNREREVLALLAEGGGNDAIAQALVISPETARTHVQNVLSRLGVHSRLEAATYVRQNGILDDLLSAEP